MAANPKLGSQLIKTSAETSKLQNEAVAKRIELSREMLTGINTPEDYLAWHESNHKDPVLGSYLSQRGVTAEDSRAKIMAELSKPGGLERLKRESALGAGKLQQELMQTERTRISSGAAYGQLALAQKRFDLEQTQQEEVAKILRGEAPTAAPTTAPTGGPTAATPVGAGSVPTGASAPTNALAPTGAPAAPVNALVAPKGDLYSEIDRLDAQIRQLAGSGNPKAIAAAQVLNAQRNALLASAKQQYGGNLIDMQVPDPTDPKRTITIKGRPDQYGRVVPAEMGAVPLSVDASATGSTTISPSVVRAAPTAGQERQAETARLKEEGQNTVNTVLNTLSKQYQGLVNEGAITDTSKGTLANLKASASSNVVGQMVGGAVGSKAQQFRDSVAQTRPLLLNAIKNASGMSAQQLNSNVELQTYLKAATDTGLSIQANVEAMNNISKMFGLGEEFKIEPPAKKGSAPSSGGAALPKGFKLD
jgi:hypothetical protein